MTRNRDPQHAIPTTVARSMADPAFLGGLCHDLRGPLGAMGTWVHVLGSGRADTDTQAQALAAIQRDIAAQTRLVEQLADLSSILGGTLALSIEEIDLPSLSEELGVRLEVRSSRSPRVLADRNRLRQLLALLLPGSGGATSADSRPVLKADDNDRGTLSLEGPTRSTGPGPVALTLARALLELQAGSLLLSSATDTATFQIQLPTPTAKS